MNGASLLNELAGTRLQGTYFGVMSSAFLHDIKSKRKHDRKFYL